eukprot:368742_1
MSALLPIVYCGTTIIEDRWIDDYSCDEWVGCNNNNQTNNWPQTLNVYHGPYQYHNNTDYVLSRSFECKYNSNLNISFYTTFDCSFDIGNFLMFDINERYQYEIAISNDIANESFSVCDDQWDIMYLTFNNISVTKSEVFFFSFAIDHIDNEYKGGSIALYDIQIECVHSKKTLTARELYIFNLAWSTFASIVYFSLYAMLVMFIAITVQMNKNYQGCKGFFKKIWQMRGIYGAVLVHLYDTATDIGVMTEWWFLAQDEKNGIDYATIDMSTLFWTSFGFLMLYRGLNVIAVAVAEKMTLQSLDKNGRYNFGGVGPIGVACYIFYLILAFLDMYIFRAVWIAASEDKDEPTGRQRLTQLMESLCESLPQILLQSVFILRGFNDPNLRNNSSVMLVLVSLFASVFSVTSKFLWLDTQAVDKGVEAELKFKCINKESCDLFPCVNKIYLLRTLWRFSMISIRFVILSLFWVVLGGKILIIYTVVSWIYWLIITRMTFGYVTVKTFGNPDQYKKIRCFIWECKKITHCESTASMSNIILVSVISIASNPATREKKLVFFRTIENIITLGILILFAFSEDMTEHFGFSITFICNICADSQGHQASQNVYIFLFMVSGLILFFIELITSFLMHYLRVFQDRSDAAAAADNLKEALENGV